MRTTAPPLRRLLPTALTPPRTGSAGVTGRRAAWWAACLLCGGLLGLALAVAGTLRGKRPSRRRVVLVAAGTAAQLLCACFFGLFALTGDPHNCPPAPRPGGHGTSAPHGGGPWPALRGVVNAPVSGAALLYGTLQGGTPYRCAATGTTAVVMDGGFARGGTMYGSVFLTGQNTEAATPRMRRLTEHEARHGDQWAITDLLAGPAGFPVLYSADEAFFPGSFNHFERQAGLADGGYAPPPDSPPAPGRLAFLTAGLLVGYLLAVSRRLRRAGRPERAVVIGPRAAEEQAETASYASSSR